ncbi:FKBP-type peptidyl-prolyl cis-trans isomerase [Parapedobacter indicus]|uniref:peptidylprolyl isomerase n=1 Tax=Parapedobacter indicus TaxID=1477437 RepID=A0A1I3D8J8_9SPHI|nr:FKBP-type peptidyl-prolyl cis-trans isomerase [Parapedobacter indicus]PPL04570.1 FKBP-type peptidyl-prolyl cis-trans isomerase [Parapedobacter indicus]SFH83037.1 FKBP-type peptidyl-prolyl cis-trans isomerase [Parapedobacter indicus]
MKKSVFSLGLATLVLAGACQQFKTGEGGLQYKIIKDGGQPKAQTGDLLSVNMTVTTDRDSLLSSTYKIGLPQIINIAADSLPGLYPGDYNSMFKMLGEGDSAVFKLNLDTMAAKTMQPKPDFADHYVTFNVKVNKHFKKGELTDSALYAEVNTYFDGEIQKLKASEEGKINDYIKKNNLEPLKTASGLQYIITEEGTGEKPVAGDTVKVNYTGALVATGDVFDTSIKEVAEKNNTYNPMRPYEPAKFAIGVRQVIPGWDEGLLLLPKGSKAKLIIPSELGYGERGDGRGVIPPFAPLVFDIELIDVLKPAANDAAAQDSTAQ